MNKKREVLDEWGNYLFSIPPFVENPLKEIEKRYEEWLAAGADEY